MPRHPRKYKKVPKSIKQYVARKIDGAIEDKHKFLLCGTEFSGIPSGTWQYSNCCNITQGATEEQRIGRKIRIKSVNLDGYLACADTTNFVRLILGLFDDSGGLQGMTLSQDIVPANNGQGSLIKKYYDKVHYLKSEPLSIGDVLRVNHIRYYKRFKKPITITYADDSATYWNKMLMWCALSDSSATPHPAFLQGHMTCTFEDA